MNNKKQVFIELNDWLRTPRGMAKNTLCIPSHSRILPFGSSAACVKHGKLWKNSVFLSFPWAPPHVPISPTPIQAALLLQWWGPKPQSGLLDNGYSGTSSSRKTIALLDGPLLHMHGRHIWQDFTISRSIILVFIFLCSFFSCNSFIWNLASFFLLFILWNWFSKHLRSFKSFQFMAVVLPLLLF